MPTNETSAYTAAKQSSVLTTVKVYYTPNTKRSFTSTALSTWLKVKCVCGIRS